MDVSSVPKLTAIHTVQLGTQLRLRRFLSYACGQVVWWRNLDRNCRIGHQLLSTFRICLSPRTETPDQMHTNEKEAMVEEDGMSVLAVFLLRMGVTLNTLYYFILWETFFSGDLALKCEICINKVVSYLQMHKPNSLWAAGIYCLPKNVASSLLLAKLRRNILIQHIPASKLCSM